jgi:hypothetical protein
LNSWCCIFAVFMVPVTVDNANGRSIASAFSFLQFVRVLICIIMFLYWAIKPTRAGLLLFLGSNFFLWYFCYVLCDFTNLNIYKLWNQTPSIRRIHMQVSQEEISVFWEVSVPVILSKILYIYMCPIPNGFRDRSISLYSTLHAVQTSNTPCPHTSCKVHWCWRWDFLKCIILGELYQLCHLNNKYRYLKQYVISLSYEQFWNCVVKQLHLGNRSE